MTASSWRHHQRAEAAPLPSRLGGHRLDVAGPEPTAADLQHPTDDRRVRHQLRPLEGQRVPAAQRVVPVGVVEPVSEGPVAQVAGRREQLGRHLGGPQQPDIGHRPSLPEVSAARSARLTRRTG